MNPNFAYHHRRGLVMDHYRKTGEIPEWNFIAHGWYRTSIVGIREFDAPAKITEYTDTKDERDQPAQLVDFKTKIWQTRSGKRLDERRDQPAQEVTTPKWIYPSE